ncbi:Uncharacterised protein [Mobiluncus mulieris]|uniref:Uncharacterized protein n=1 Tax=Mobiluncus mulieris TaxID=2052 RepID=A0A8G2M6E1_9ACTO|nr:hypothetical protein [Mobiluncus mulieris]STO15772.1 Uncharacterised protein [Mobiluncus mulieris]
MQFITFKEIYNIWVWVYFSTKGCRVQDFEIVKSSLGYFRVQTREQALLDLVSRPDWGLAPHEALNAVRALLAHVNRAKTTELAQTQKLQSLWNQFLSQPLIV